MSSEGHFEAGKEDRMDQPELTPELAESIRRFEERKAKRKAEAAKFKAEIRNIAEPASDVTVEAPIAEPTPEPEFESIYHKGASRHPGGVAPWVKDELDEEDRQAENLSS